MIEKKKRRERPVPEVQRVRSFAPTRKRPDAQKIGPEAEDRANLGPRRAPRKRTSLSHVGGDVVTRGDEDSVHVLAEALRATDADPDRADAFTHGFHTYPGRMHPAIAREAIRAFSSGDDIVLDPFCGGGTVVLEAMLQGRRPLGVDLNPLAIRLADVRTMRRDRAARKRFLATLEAVAVRSEERVRSRVDSRAPLTRDEIAWYDVHVLKELAGLREEILVVPDRDDKRALFLVFSAIVVKLSKQRADTTEEEVTKRLRKGLVTEFFVRKGRELAERWESVDRALPEDARAPKLFEGDARDLERVLPKRLRAHLVLTSPPYGGTYDYVAHHARRYPWLGIDPTAFERGEIGARRKLAADERAARWDAELAAVLRAIARVRARRDAPVVLLVGDAQIGRLRIAADAQIEKLAPQAGLVLRAAAAQERPDHRGGAPRREHLLLLR